jgi:glyceraldehyde-3-phosphate dehydrogenase (NADP+)
VIAEAEQATADDLEAAIDAARRAFGTMRQMPRHARRDLLIRVSARLAAERRPIAEELARSCGKPITQALGEVDRAILTFSFAGDEARRFGGEVIPLDVDPRTEQATGVVHRFPIGPISAISPFNFPLNLLAHKVAPAIAVGSAVVVKPPPQCPQIAFRLARILAECGLPAGACNVLHLPIPLAERLATDERFRLLTFTGSAAVGWHLKTVAGKKRVVLELGGNAAAVVHDDFTDLDWLAPRLAVGAFAYAGQVCIKVQRLFIQRSIYRPLVDKFVAATNALAIGDPMDARTVVGPMIAPSAADRVERWIAEAEQAGAKALVRGRRQNTVLGPTVLSDAPASAKVNAEEVFGPVVTVAPYDDFGEALAAVNDSRYGLQAGVFTHDVRRIHEAFRSLEVGGVIANDLPTTRVDHYPYGGVKDSGFGREGLRYAMDDMSEPRMLFLDLAH